MTKRKSETYRVKFLSENQEKTKSLILNKEKHQKILPKENEQILSKIVSSQGFKKI